jgi:LDH2 family malate/lactate/ureidoglycolate dehydrogenase
MPFSLTFPSPADALGSMMELIASSLTGLSSRFPPMPERQQQRRREGCFLVALNW